MSCVPGKEMSRRVKLPMIGRRSPNHWDSRGGAGGGGGGGDGGGGDGGTKEVPHCKQSVATSRK